MSPTETLRHEHKIVLMVLEGAEKQALIIKNTGIVDTDKIKKIIDFSQNFTDGCHHTKEEKQLFPKMCERGFSKEAGPVAVMLSEHIEGRKLISKIESNLNLIIDGDEFAKSGLSSALMDYTYLLRSHISKENDILFTMADRALSSEDMDLLNIEFERIEREDMGVGEHEKYHNIAHEIVED